MPEQDEAEIQSGAQPDDPQTDSFRPDDAAQPVELQSPEGELPAEETQPDAAQPDVAQPDVAQPFQVAAAEETQPDVVQPVEAVPEEETQPDVAQPVEVTSAEELQPDVAEAVEVAAAEETQPEKVVLQPEPRRLSRGERDQYERQRRRFAACGRCGYFLADCRVYLGEEALQTAVLAADDGWLRLEGDATFRRLLQNAYGVRHDVAYDYLDGSCPECRRRFVFAEQDDGPTRLKIHV